MTTRRDFLIGSGAAVLTLAASRPGRAQRRDGFARRAEVMPPSSRQGGRPLVVSTWPHGVASNAAAWEVLAAGGPALDAVEQGVRVAEADPEVTSVGYGGRPDREGYVTLDACIMDETGNAGSVAFLQGIMHPISVARLVMEKTPHVMLVGEGARRFALAQGFAETDLLTPASHEHWQQWLETAQYRAWTPPDERDAPNGPGQPYPEHDTISMLAIDRGGDLSGSCTTSGLAYKMHGRVGDSPIIGAALFVDNAVGAACATGVGEEVMKTLGSFLIVELMRQGRSPAEACQEAVQRIATTNPRWQEVQVGYLAIDTRGNIGAYALQPGFQFAVHDQRENVLLDAASWAG